MRKPLRLLSLLAGLSLVAAACADLSGPSNQLTDDEAAFLAQEFAGEALEGVNHSMEGSPGMAGSPSIAGAAADRPNSWPVTWERTFSVTRTCPAGGTVTSSGSNTGDIDENGDGTVEISHVLAMEDCARTRDAVTITVNTDPDLTMTGTVTIENGQRTGGTFTKTGTFLWETSDGRSGSCEVDLTITWDGNSGWHHGQLRGLKGNVCGRDVNSLGARGINGLVGNGRKP